MQRLTPEQAWAALKNGEELVDLYGAFLLTYRRIGDRLEFRKTASETWQKSSVTIRQFFDVCKWARPDSPETTEGGTADLTQPGHLGPPFEPLVELDHSYLDREAQVEIPPKSELEKRVDRLEAYLTALIGVFRD